MNSAADVRNMIANWRAMGLSKAETVVLIAEACLEWPYVWGAYGQECTVSQREYFMGRSAIGEDDKELIRKRCQVLNGSRSACTGCKYYPGGARTLIFDCRGFTRWVLEQVGISLQGAGATSQWNNNSNWSEKGEIKNMPAGAVCCVFKYDSSTGKMDHTGLAFGDGQIIHCSVEVKRGKVTDPGWTHYAIPKGIDGTMPEPVKPTIRRGSRGPYVTECQEDLIKCGYDVGPKGADGIFGKATEQAVKLFQGDHNGPDGKPLKVDGIVGQATWWALDQAVGPQPEPGPVQLYTVTVPHLTQDQAEDLAAQYPGATVAEETNNGRNGA